ncbi:TetR family transcriptional regulator protein [Scytonema sp. HK-05]|nr:hypothetical protein NIES2130_14985 [Scytonema sp. HK-05]BAY43979.1 TetR family transcriptional regulator protein [Scytonema sp. HK-05]
MVCLQIQGSLRLARSLDNTVPFERVLERLPKELLLASGLVKKIIYYKKTRNTYENTVKFL